jgi:UDPglucose 6-dehydrogenase
MPTAYAAAQVLRPEEAVQDADAILVGTEWEAFRNLPYAAYLSLMRGTVLVDARNMLDPRTMIESGFLYDRIGGVPPFFT